MVFLKEIKKKKMKRIKKQQKNGIFVTQISPGPSPESPHPARPRTGPDPRPTRVRPARDPADISHQPTTWRLPIWPRRSWRHQLTQPASAAFWPPGTRHTRACKPRAYQKPKVHLTRGLWDWDSSGFDQNQPKNQPMLAWHVAVRYLVSGIVFSPP